MDACQSVSLYCKGEATITTPNACNVLIEKNEDHFNMLEKTLSQGQRQGSTILYTFIDQVFTKFVSVGYVQGYAAEFIVVYTTRLYCAYMYSKDPGKGR